MRSRFDGRRITVPRRSYCHCFASLSNKLAANNCTLTRTLPLLCFFAQQTCRGTVARTGTKTGRGGTGKAHGSQTEVERVMNEICTGTVSPLNELFKFFLTHTVQVTRQSQLLTSPDPCVRFMAEENLVEQQALRRANFRASVVVRDVMVGNPN